MIYRTQLSRRNFLLISAALVTWLTTMEDAVRNAPAILVGWFLGTETGPALADILFGNVSPSGRLPVTFPLSTGQQPYYYARERAEQVRRLHSESGRRTSDSWIGRPSASSSPVTSTRGSRLRLRQASQHDSRSSEPGPVSACL